LLVGNYTFGCRREEAELLARLAKVARTADAPFLAACSLSALGCESVADLGQPRKWNLAKDPDAVGAWQALRRLPEASYLGLCLPRFLLRLPYGKDTDVTEQFDFEEMSSPPDHEEYLWGNPAFACAFLLAQAFRMYGWEMQAGVVSELDNMPLHVYKKDGESLVKPCSEVLLSEGTTETILERGLIPLFSVKDCDVVRVVRFQPLAEPPTRLSGRWR